MDSPPMPLRFVKSVSRAFTSSKSVVTMRVTTRKKPGSENKWVSQSGREGEEFGKCMIGRMAAKNCECTSALNHEIFDGAMEYRTFIVERPV